jgi:histidyl-tRNA synthetase
MKFQAIKGVRDILPPESALWNRVEQAARSVFHTYGYGEIRLPIFEPTELFARSVGLDTDIVSKEMFRLDQQYESQTTADLAHLRETIMFMVPSSADERRVTSFREKLKKFHDDYQEALKKGKAYQYEGAPVGLQYLEECISGLNDILKLSQRTDWQVLFDRSVGLSKDYLGKILLEPTSALRPEATASVVRAYIEHGMHTRPGNVKLYYIGPMFRRERPQKGRYRQFYQVGAELLGPSDHPALDAEVIEMLLAFFAQVNLHGAKLYINSIGDKNCRPTYVERLRGELLKVRDKLGADSQRRIETNPLRVLDSKLPEEQVIIDTLPHIADHLCDACREHYAELKRQLALRKIEYEENWRLVRGLDYYMRTTFEITAPGLGSQNAVCGGGRYDGLVELLGGPAATKGIGFAIGTDRLMLSLQEAGAAAKCAVDVYIAWMGSESYPAAVTLGRTLREHGFTVELPAEEMKLGKSLNLADRLGARNAVIIGEEELLTGRLTVRPLFEKREPRPLPTKQEKLAEAELLEYLTKSRTA